MSARLEFVPLGLQPESDQMHPPTSSAGANRRSVDPVDVLGRKMDQICVAAVSPLEIAAALEMDGINDRSAREVYGHDDIFALADALYVRVPFRQKSQPVPTQPKLSLVDVTRGLLYALPGLMIAGFGLTNADSSFETTLTVTAGLVFGAIFSWAWSQGMARLGYIKRGQSAPKQAGRTLMLGLGIGTVVVSVLTTLMQAGLGLFNGVMPIIAVAQTLYSLAAVILFTLERPFVLFYFAIPGLATAFMRWNGLIDLQQTLILAAFWLLSLIVYTFAIAIRFGHNAKAVKVPLFTVTELLGSIPFVLQGAFSALLLAFNTLMSLYGVQAGEFPPSSYAIIPLVLTMGFAELELSRYRGKMNHILYVTSDLEQFRIAAQRVFADSLGRYLLVLIAFLIISGLAGNVVRGSINQDLFFVLAEGLFLGAGFFASFILIAHNRVGDVVLSTALAILVRLWLLLIPADVVGIVNLAQSELIASAIFAIATLLIARSIVGKLGTLA